MRLVAIISMRRETKARRRRGGAESLTGVTRMTCSPVSAIGKQSTETGRKILLSPDGALSPLLVLQMTSDFRNMANHPIAALLPDHTNHSSLLAASHT